MRRLVGEEMKLLLLVSFLFRSALNDPADRGKLIV